MRRERLPGNGEITVVVHAENRAPAVVPVQVGDGRDAVATAGDRASGYIGSEQVKTALISAQKL
jgi:hypothetical protein